MRSTCYMLHATQSRIQNTVFSRNSLFKSQKSKTAATIEHVAAGTSSKTPWTISKRVKNQPTLLCPPSPWPSSHHISLTKCWPEHRVISHRFALHLQTQSNPIHPSNRQRRKSRNANNVPTTSNKNRHTIHSLTHQANPLIRATLIIRDENIALVLVSPLRDGLLDDLDCHAFLASDSGDTLLLGGKRSLIEVCSGRLRSWLCRLPLGDGLRGLLLGSEFRRLSLGDGLRGLPLRSGSGLLVRWGRCGVLLGGSGGGGSGSLWLWSVGNSILWRSLGLGLRLRLGLTLGLRLRLRCGYGLEQRRGCCSGEVCQGDVSQDLCLSRRRSELHQLVDSRIV
jgi:hypothetical protein